MSAAAADVHRLTYDLFVRAEADGTTRPHPDAVEMACAAAGKSLAQFRGDVQRRLREMRAAARGAAAGVAGPAARPRTVTVFEQFTGIPLPFAHEAAHAVVARRLGLGVGAVLVERSGEGWTLVGFDDTPAGLVYAAITAAAAAALYQMTGEPELGWCDDDRAKIEAYHARYVRATGRPLPPVHASARELLRQADIYADVLRVARALKWGVGIGAQQLDAILGIAPAAADPEPVPAEPEPVDVGFAI